MVITLTDEQRQALDRLLRTGSHSAAIRRRASILLLSDADSPDAWSDHEIARHLYTTLRTVQRVRQQLAAEGFDATLHRKKPTGRQYRKLDGIKEARLVVLACSAAREGHASWTMVLLADFARFLRTLADEHYSSAEKIVLVCDNLSTHTTAAL